MRTLLSLLVCVTIFLVVGSFSIIAAILIGPVVYALFSVMAGEDH